MFSKHVHYYVVACAHCYIMHDANIPVATKTKTLAATTVSAAGHQLVVVSNINRCYSTQKNGLSRYL